MILSDAGKGPPRDSKQVHVVFQRVPGTIYYSMSSVAALGIVMSVFFLLVNIINREHRYVETLFVVECPSYFNGTDSLAKYDIINIYILSVYWCDIIKIRL